MKLPYEPDKKQLNSWRTKLYEIIFEAETPAGKLFDVVLLIAIVVSIVAVMLESVPEIKLKHGAKLYVLEWVLTGLFTVEYIARILCIKRPIKYILSFYGLVDLLSILPSYLGFFLPHDTRSLSVIRSLRLMRVFRILKMAQYIGETNLLLKSLRASRAKIIIFLFFILSITFIIGSVMYIIEPVEAGFTSIPRSVYWAIVTITTVGYGDIAPMTSLGQSIASLMMIIGYAIIAVPTGIVTAEMTKTDEKKQPSVSTRVCTACGSEGHDYDAKNCKYCGESL